jgi:ketosteroid isomerase-like protein
MLTERRVRSTFVDYKQVLSEEGESRRMAQATRHAASPREIYAQLADAQRDLHADRYAELFAPEGVLELPFRRPGIPARREGREAIRQAAKAGWTAGPLRFEAVSNVRVHETTDPEVLVAEHDLVGVRIGVGTTNGRSCTLPFVWVLAVRDGQIAVLREYLNVIAIALATDRLPGLATDLDEARASGDTEWLRAVRKPLSRPDTRAAPAAAAAGAAAAGPRELFARYQGAVLTSSPDTIADLFAADGVFEMPFTVPGMAPRHEGREQVRARLHGLLGRFRFEEYRNVQVHQTTDPEVVVVEHDIAGTIAATGRPHVMSYVYVLRVRDGAIVHLRDYPNLLAASETSGGLHAFLARFAT